MAVLPVEIDQRRFQHNDGTSSVANSPSLARPDPECGLTA
jgi:hypothetical protein